MSNDTTALGGLAEWQRAAGVKLIDLAASWAYDFTSISDICRGKTRVSAGGPLTRRFTHHRKAVAS